MSIQDWLRLKLAEAITSQVPHLTRRVVRLPTVPGKAMAVIRVPRSGKTTFLSQLLAKRQAADAPRDALLMRELEDDQLLGLKASDLAWLMEEYFRQYPAFRGVRPVTLFLDEIQTVPGW